MVFAGSSRLPSSSASHPAKHRHLKSPLGAALFPSSGSLSRVQSNGSMMDVSDATGSRPGTRGTPPAIGFDSATSLHDFEVDDVTASFFASAREPGENVSPTLSASGAGGGQSTASAAASKAKRPHLFAQLANELRWMHHNLRNGYDPNNSSLRPYYTAVTPDSAAPSPSDASPCVRYDDGFEEDLFISPGLPSSMRRSVSSLPNCTPTSGSATARGVAGGTAKPRGGARDGAEVPPQGLEATPDPFAPRACAYVLRQPDDDVESFDGVEGLEDEEEHGESCADGNPLTGVGRCPVVGQPCIDSLASSQDDGVGAPVTTVPVRSRSRLSSLKSLDAYEVFLSGVASLQRQLHTLSQLTEHLRTAYAHEQHARQRSRGKGQHLSWTRTVQAANTIQFWRQKVSTLRLFESHFLHLLAALQRELRLVSPAVEQARADDGIAITFEPRGVVADERRRFLTSHRVIAAQLQHLRRLGSDMQTCWRANAALREELRRFEQQDARVPHETFAIAGMDTEHFIASLPPRTSTFALPCSALSSHTSLPSLDSEAGGATPLLLTVQNMSPLSSDGTDGVVTRAMSGVVDDAAMSRPPTSSRPIACGSPNLAPASPLVSCLKRTSASASPVPPRRLKYVICSASFDRDEAEGPSLSPHSAPSHVASPLLGSALSATESLTRRRNSRHVTFALEPEVLDARPRVSAHGRTVELLEQICLDKQALWSPLPMVQEAVEAHRSQLSAWRAQASLGNETEGGVEEEEEGDVLASVPSDSLERCRNVRGADNSLTSPLKPPGAARPKKHSCPRKVKENGCVTCTMM